jgi:hypothetical protein
MNTEENNEVVRKRQENIDATTKTTENDGNKEEETLNTVSYEDIKESSKDANEIEEVVQE